MGNLQSEIQHIIDHDDAETLIALPGFGTDQGMKDFAATKDNLMFVTISRSRILKLATD